MSAGDAAQAVVFRRPDGPRLLPAAAPMANPKGCGENPSKTSRSEVPARSRDGAGAGTVPPRESNISATGSPGYHPALAPIPSPHHTGRAAALAKGDLSAVALAKVDAGSSPRTIDP
jgi:hypothetical protein